MTSPDGDVPNGAYQANSIFQMQSVTEASLAADANSDMQAAAEAVREQFLTNIYNAIGQIPVIGGLLDALIQALTGGSSLVDDVVAGIDNLIATALRQLGSLLDGIPVIGDTLEEVCDAIANWINSTNATANTAATTADSAVIVGVANSTAIATLQTQQTSSTTGGASVTEPIFPASLVNSLGTGWTLGGNTGTAQWGTDTNGHAGLIANGSLPAGIRAALSTTVMATDQCSVTMIVGANGGDHAMTSAILHAAADLSSFVYANVFNGSLYLGSGGFNSSTGAWTFDDFPGGPAAINLPAGGTVKVTATKTGGIYTYAATLNGYPVKSRTDTTGVAPSGSSNRYVGMLSQQEFDGVLGILNVGWTVAGFTAADLTSPAVVGTGVSLYRAATTSVNTSTISGTNWGTFGTGTLDTIRQASGMTVTNLGTGVVTATKAGWYTCSVGAQFSSTVAGTTLSAGVAVTPAGGSLAMARAGWAANAGTSQALIAGVAGTFIVYLSVGDSVQPAVFDSAGAIGLVGTGIGDLTYFDVTLASGAGG